MAEPQTQHNGTIVNRAVTPSPKPWNVSRPASRERNHLFALVDREAEKVGMKMPDTKLLIFGSPKAGTPLMLAAPSSALDLGLKIVVAEDAQGKAWISHNSPT
jgi:uncharacterized protein DUF302